MRGRTRERSASSKSQSSTGRRVTFSMAASPRRRLTASWRRTRRSDPSRCSGEAATHAPTPNS
eukprot:5528200-Prymnesium_polylepis.1